MSLIYPYTEYDRFCKSLNADSLKDTATLKAQIQHILATTSEIQEMALISQDGIPLVVVGQTLDKLAELIAAQAALSDQVTLAWGGQPHEMSFMKFGERTYIGIALHAEVLVTTLRVRR